jgi:hypothetical protein
VLLGSSPHRSAVYSLRQMGGAQFRHCAVSWLGLPLVQVSARAALNFGAAALLVGVLKAWMGVTELLGFHALGGGLLVTPRQLSCAAACSD